MKLEDISRFFDEHGKLLGVLVFTLLIVSMSGFFMGMRQTDRELQGYRAPVEVEETVSAEHPPAPRYAEIPDSELKVNRDWHFDLTQLQARGRMPDTVEPLDAEELAEVMVQRGEKRAFDGAPPMIPHEIDQRRMASCMSCHGPDSTVQISSLIPSEISHPYFSNCTQCHVPVDGLRQLAEPERSRLVVDNRFDGLGMIGVGTRAYPGAPPTIPHALWMRQNCAACHGPGRENAIRTSHPTRGNCLQCHAPNGALDNRERIPMAAPAP